ncbi:periplasmic thiol:disulfide oxidoreductase, DsbE subfamily protein [Paraburkholderia xenovorans LB400]|uniref:Periplasmic protein thiol-disulfide oxidoreductase DsbE n=1 Tax=Paraburkholderia xenovorans (strain LB400) TaxID=266265 RepID=Q13I07_PARXL|nr:DsbE family thiol:disulfide interchange protein [Paraburkholderia xenovorans]ABE36282.1 Periplasmic protein thiol-disulfide oxidoreductase DsbE [Paraburkholderia xenovorans LB400]AIP34257.1 periplasmic thiol:disulfide oxidoreductase, DsbE subfamily protein [Paraburkholderia xenovorans LB400]
MKRVFVPLIGFAVLVAVLAAGLRHDPRRLPSALIGQPAPSFDLPGLGATDKRVSPQVLRGQVWILNVWASWCESCRDEHPLLVDLAARRIAPVYGMDYKDERAPALQWLAEAGDPYTASFVDHSGQTGIDYGVYGVPETFVIDRAGIIRYRHAGPLTRQSLDGVILPLVRQLQHEDINGS